MAENFDLCANIARRLGYRAELNVTQHRFWHLIDPYGEDTGNYGSSEYAAYSTLGYGIRLDDTEPLLDFPYTMYKLKYKLNNEGQDAYYSYRVESYHAPQPIESSNLAEALGYLYLVVKGG